jgi:ABC-2 type transport system permease protein
MLAFSGLFVPVAALPPVLRAVASVLPLTYAVNLLEGIWNGDGWLPHMGDVAALTVLFLIFTAISAKVFRWE